MGKKSVLTEPKGREIVLSDGKTYKLPPSDINTIAELEDVFDCSLQEITERLNQKQATTLRQILYGLLTNGYPDLTLDDVGKLVRIKDVGDVMNIITEVLTDME
jgi:hypothetical protein